MIISKKRTSNLTLSLPAIFLLFAMLVGCTPEVSLNKISPQSTKAGIGFNIQPNGDSIMIITTANADIKTLVNFNGKQFKPEFIGRDDLHIVVEKYVISRPGDYPLSLFDPVNNKTSEEVIFKVK